MDIMKLLGFKNKDAEKKKGKRLKNDTVDKPFRFNITDKYPREIGETRIYNLIILDESGSMTSIKEQALSGANETLQTIRSAQKENADDHQMISFVTFSTGVGRSFVRSLIECEKIESAYDFAREQYQPNGGTPLYDAMGYSITALRNVVKDGDNVHVTVITDGFENSSHAFSAEMIKDLVGSLTNKGWVFAYIGANQDSKQSARSLGIRSAMDFKASTQGSTIMWEKMQSR